MPAGKSVITCSLTIIAVAAFAGRFFEPKCPLATPPIAGTSTEDPQWGQMSNLTRTGDVFAATPSMGYHRIIRVAHITEPGLYRISVETRYEGSDHMEIELGDSSPQQPYGIVIVNLRTGKVEKTQREVLNAGVEAIGNGTGHYRWWVEEKLNPGNFAYDFALLSADDDSVQYAGSTQSCRMALSNPQVTRAPGAQAE